MEAERSKKARPSAWDVLKSFYRDEFKRNTVKNLIIFGVGVWFAREFSSIELIAPAVAPS